MSVARLVGNWGLVWVKVAPWQEAAGLSPSLLTCPKLGYPSRPQSKREDPPQPPGSHPVPQRSCVLQTISATAVHRNRCRLHSASQREAF